MAVLRLVVSFRKINACFVKSYFMSTRDLTKRSSDVIMKTYVCPMGTTVGERLMIRVCQSSHGRQYRVLFLMKVKKYEEPLARHFVEQ